LDIVFSEPTGCRRRSPPTSIATSTRNPEQAARTATNDQVMARRSKQSRRVVLGETGLPTVQPLSDAQPLPVGVGFSRRRSEVLRLRFPRASSERPPVLGNAAAARVFMSARALTAIVRRVPMV